MKKLCSVLFILLLTFNNLNAQGERPKNIIILIGDGMGINYVGASILQNAVSPFNDFKSIGLSITCSADKLITDSAAGASAIATGYLTNNKYISVDTLGNPLTTIFEYAESLGLSTGVVVSSTVSHATPGAFLGHTKDRNDQITIAEQMVLGNYDVIIGGGLKYFLPKNLNGDREDQNNLLEILQKKGFQTAKNFPELTAIEDSVKQFYALLEMDGLPEASKRNFTLGDLTKQAITHLKNNDNGFVLMIEGSQIDWAGHDHKSKELLEEVNDFSTAITEALNFAKSDGNTLIVVTSDHETGGMSITKGSRNAVELELSYTTTSHTASPVGIFSYGPGEEIFRGIMNINNIGQNLFKLLNPDYKF